MPRIIDGRDMLPPEPLEATLAALNGLPADDEVVLLLYRQPHPLFGILRNEGCVWNETVLADGTLEFRIRKR